MAKIEKKNVDPGIIVASIFKGLKGKMFTRKGKSSLLIFYRWSTLQVIVKIKSCWIVLYFFYLTASY